MWCDADRRLKFYTHCPNISAAEGGVSCMVEAKDARECGDSSERKRRWVAAQSARACDGRRNAAMMADGRLWAGNLASVECSRLSFLFSCEREITWW